MPWICLSPKCSPTDPTVDHQHLMFILSTASEELLSLIFYSAPELRGVTSYKQQSNEIRMKAPIFCGVECFWTITLQSFSVGGSGGIRVSSRTNETTIDALNSNDMAEKSLFRKPWAASIGTHLHNPPIFSKVLVTSKHAAMSYSNV